MSNTLPQQQDLETYRKTGELGSLSNIFIEDCLEELKSNKTARDRFNLTSYVPCFIDNEHDLVFWDGALFESLREDRRIYTINKMLSTTPNGAVMPFLDVETKEYKGLQEELEDTDFSIARPNYDYHCKKMQLSAKPKTLDHLLYREFTETLRICKNTNQALEIINKIYIDNIYV